MSRELLRDYICPSCGYIKENVYGLYEDTLYCPRCDCELDFYVDAFKEQEEG